MKHRFIFCLDHSHTNDTIYILNFIANLIVIGGRNVQHGVCIVALGTVEHVFNVDTVRGNDTRDIGQHIGNVFVDDTNTWHPHRP